MGSKPHFTFDLEVNFWKFLILTLVFTSIGVQKTYCKVSEDQDLIFDDLQTSNKDNSYFIPDSPSTFDDEDGPPAKDLLIGDFDDFAHIDNVDDADDDLEPNDDNIDDPYDSDLKEIQHEETSNWLVKGVKRIRREISKLFGENDEKTKPSMNDKKKSNKGKKPKTQEEKAAAKAKRKLDRKLKKQIEKRNEKRDKKRQSKNLKSLKKDDLRSKRQYSRDDDDEDLSGSGNGGIFQFSTHYFRLTLTVREYWVEDFQDVRSEAFRNLSNSLAPGLEELYNRDLGQDADDTIYVDVIRISQTSDPFKVHATINIRSKREVNPDEFEQAIRDRIEVYSQIGDVSVELSDFSLRPVEEHEEPYDLNHETDLEAVVCDAYEQFACSSRTQCIPLAMRCDNLEDCEDGSDEVGCEDLKFTFAYTTQVPNWPIQTDGGVYNGGGGGSGEPDIQGPDYNNTHIYNTGRPPISTGGSISGGCRGDDTFTCPQSRVQICDVQRCDGSIDCPNGEDEINCSECEENEFGCDETRCIPESRKCDNRRDCNDGTDEMNCPTHSQGKFIKFLFIQICICCMR